MRRSTRHVFDLQAHRGGAGLWPENTLEAFGRALALGVSTLELDVHLTARGRRRGRPRPGRRRRAADPRAHPRRPAADDAAAAPGRGAARRARRRPGADQPRDQVRRPRRRGLTTREAFVARVVDALRIDGLVGRTSIQCFDWGVLDRVGEAEPALARNLLVSPKYLRDADGAPSPWFDGLAVDADFVATAARRASRRSRRSTARPSAPAWTTRRTRRSRRRRSSTPRTRPGSPSSPTSSTTRPRCATSCGLGVDGLITNRPDLLRDVLADEGRELPPAFPGWKGNLPADRSVSST